MKEKLYSIKRKFTDLETDKSFRVSKRTLLNKEKRHRMPLKPEKRPAGPPKSGENPEIVDDVALRERFPACSALSGWYNEPALRAPAPSPDHNARPQWMTILKMSSGIRTGIRSTYGRSPSWFEPL